MHGLNGTQPGGPTGPEVGTGVISGGVADVGGVVSKAEAAVVAAIAAGAGVAGVAGAASVVS